LLGGEQGRISAPTNEASVELDPLQLAARIRVVVVSSASRHLRPILEKPICAVAVISEALVTAVNEARPDFPQIACRNRRLAHHTERFSAGHPAIDQYESHVVLLNAIE
jgi:hypothetical protein